MEPLLVTPAEAVAMTGIGRTRIYQLLESGDLPSIRIGRSVRIPLVKLREWIDHKSRSTQAAETSGNH